MKIIHSVPILNRIFGSLINSNFWYTEVHNDGIQITRWIGAPILIRWAIIQKLDLSGLEGKCDQHLLKLGLKQKAIEKRFFLIMIDDHQLVKKACTLSSILKTWFAAKNVLGITSIDANCSKSVSSRLQKEAQHRQISLEHIIIDSHTLNLPI